jgi:cellulose synthase/poly-beta-1,6-N-acetylglucosamine synthase-like glycosyltransferase
MELIFWLLIFLCFYGYFGYPLLLALISPWAKRYRDIPGQTEDGPSVSILVPAFNESDYITVKIDSLLNQNYPAERFDIWVLNDGSEDNTADIIRNYEDPRVHLLDLPRGGKATALNKGVASSANDIIVFSDADNEWTPDTLMRLVSPFTLDSVGAVSGRLTIREDTSHLGLGDLLYRNFEAFVRRSETRLGSAVSADGGIFAIRRELYEPIPQDVTDDFFISTGAIINGKALIFQPDAIAYDDGVEKAENQLRRRIRVTVRGMTSLWRRRQLFNPNVYGIYSLCLLSHKLIRRFVPFFALFLLPVNMMIAGQGGFYQLLLWLQILFYASAVAGLIDKGKNLPKPFSMAGFLLLSTYGLGLGIVQFVTGRRYTFWSPEQNR